MTIAVVASPAAAVALAQAQEAQAHYHQDQVAALPAGVKSHPASEPLQAQAAKSK